MIIWLTIGTSHSIQVGEYICKTIHVKNFHMLPTMQLLVIGLYAILVHAP